MLSVRQGGIKYHFFFGMTRPGNEHRSPRLLANTWTIMVNQLVEVSKYTHFLDVGKRKSY